MNIVDILLIVLILSYIARGFKNGTIKEVVLFIGSILVMILAFILKNPVSVYMYEHLPFFGLDGIFAGVSVINILIYELIAFLIVGAVLMFIFRTIVLASSLIEGILKATIILEIPSKIIGLVIGAVEGLCVSFVLLFLTYQFTFTKNFIDKSQYGTMILTKTPVLSQSTEPIYKSINEIHEVADKYKNEKDKSNVNYEALEILLKYKIIKPENAKVLVDSKKLDINGADELINKYQK